MSLTCPRCGRVLEYTGEPPSFCAYCGHRLALASTVNFDAEAVTLAPRAGADGEPSDVPQQVGGYRILRPLGGGGMGRVFEAEEVATARHVALKLIAPDSATSSAAIERFRQEGRLASTIAHPRCVFVLAADEDAGRPYIVMELMPGDTLENLVQKQGPLPPEEGVARILDVIDGLREAHRLGVVHRDVKPSNCFLEADGRVKVGDFGLAKSLVNQAHLTRTGTFLGTLLYCSPEQVRGEPVDLQSDVYSVAATLYYLLAGKAPFQTGDAAATLARIVADPAPPLRGLRKDIPAALDQVVLRGLERDRQRRWRSLDDFRAALLPFVPGRLSIGGLGLRLGAYLLDTLILLPLVLTDSFLQIRGPSLHVSVGVLRFVEGSYLLLLLLYYGVPEGLWGWTLGKRWLRLRVWRADRCDPPGLLRGLVRAGIWLTLLTLPNEIGVFLVDPYEVEKNDVLASQMIGIQFLVFCGGLVLTLCTMRVRNGYRCLHDVLTGTRVICLPEPERRWSPPNLRLDDSLTPVPGRTRLGGFTVRGALGRSAEEQVLLGEDPVLGRPVLLWLRPVDAPPLGAVRRNLTRPSRLRWLAAGEDQHGRWDALLAPAGCSLADLVAAHGPLTWPETRPVLEQLTDELAAATADDTLPPTLSLGQVWIQANAQVVLLDMPLGDLAPSPEEVEVFPEQEEGLALLGGAAVLALEGRSRSPDASPGPVRAPVPGYARQFLMRLLALQRPFADVQQVQKSLAAIRDRPAEVRWPRRAGHLAVLIAFLWTGMSCLFMGGWLPTYMAAQEVAANAYRLEHVRRDLEDGAWREFLAAELTPSPVARLGALVQLDADLRVANMVAERRDHNRLVYQEHLQAIGWPTRALLPSVAEPPWDREFQSFRPRTVPEFANWDLADWYLVAVIQTVLVAFWPIVWVLWAFVVRGGLSFRLLGLSLVRGDGRPAARWQCAWRALLVWTPVTALLIGTVWLEQQYWVSRVAGTPWNGLLWLAQLTGGSAWVLLLAYIGLALWHPARGPHDRLAGTYLVPR
jgi:hypothetical protein